MTKYYEFAGVGIAVHVSRERMYTEDRNLAPFRVEKAQNPHHFYFDMVEELTPPVGEPIVRQPDFLVYHQNDSEIRYIGGVQESWADAHMRTERRGNEHFVQLKARLYPGGVTAKTVLNAAQAEHLVAQNQGFVFHCSYIVWQGKAILFTAPSGTGKSTQADLWETLRGAEIINGDRAVIRAEDGSVTANGIPFAGSSQICKNATLPLAAVVYLAQASETTIRKLRGAEAFRRIWEGVSVNTWDKEDMSLVMDTVQAVVQAVPVYYLACTPDENAVAALERQLGK